VAVVGRSNVGKSSLLRALSIKPLGIRVEDRPGTTQAIAFYELPGLLRLVDFPGYGFAYADGARRAAWREAADTYFKSRKVLRRVWVLVDSRHGIKQSDEAMMDQFDSLGIKYQVVLTKADLVGAETLAKRVVDVRESLRNRFRHALWESTTVFSSKNKGNVPELWAELGGLMDQTELGTIRAKIQRFTALAKEKEEREAAEQRKKHVARLKKNSPWAELADKKVAKLNQEAAAAAAAAAAPRSTSPSPSASKPVGGTSQGSTVPKQRVLPRAKQR
jgi:GTP-binding protein